MLSKKFFSGLLSFSAWFFQVSEKVKNKLLSFSFTRNGYVPKINTSSSWKYCHLHEGEVLLCSNQPSMSSAPLWTVWTSTSCRTTGNGTFPLVSFLALPPYLARTHRQKLLWNLITILLPIPLSSNFRIKCCKIILSRNCQAASAVRAAVSLAAIAHARSPGMSFLTPPPIAVIVKGCHIHRRLTIVQIAGPLPSQFRINDRQACLLRNQTILFAIRTSRTICPVIGLGFPDVSFITHPKIRFRAVERHLLRQSFSVLIITPLCGKFRRQRSWDAVCQKSCRMASNRK